MERYIVDVSIIVPGYNCSKTVEKCLNSIVSQEFFGEIEIIYVDDASTDNSVSVCRRFFLEKNFTNFKIIVHEANSGSPSAGRNRGVAESRGTYIFFCDADDFIVSDCLQRLFSLAEEHNSDYTVALHYQIRRYPDGDLQFQLNLCGLDSSDLPSVIIVDDAYLTRYLNEYFKFTRSYCLFEHCWGRLYRACVIKECSLLFEEEFDQLEDVMFNAQYLLFANNVVVLPVALYNHNLISSSSRLSLSSGENQRLLKDLSTVFAHLATLKRQLTESAAPPTVSKAEMKTFLSSKVANYLFRLIIQINNSPVFKRTNYSSSFQAFLDFYVLEKLYEFEFIAADESRLLRKMFRYQLPISAYLVIWKSILFVRLVRKGI